MWIALAAISFIAGQVYLFRCLRKLDCFLLQHAGEDEAKSGNDLPN